MRKIIIALLSVFMLLTLCACGAEETAAEETVEAPAEEKAAEKATSAGFEPVTFEFAEATVSVVGAEEFTDAEGEPAVRFYYDFTNNSDVPTSAWWTLNYAAEQAGFDLVSTYASVEDDVAEYGNSSLDIYPGVTIRCIEEFSYDPDADGVLTFIIDDYNEEYSVDIDTTALPGRPAGELTVGTLAKPTLTTDLSAEGVGDGYTVSIDDAEVVDGWDEADVIRVYFTYTNNMEEASSCWSALSVEAFQDGVELETQWAAEDAAEDEAFNEAVEPGDSIYCSECWELRSESPVEIYIYDYMTEAEIGASFPVA